MSYRGREIESKWLIPKPTTRQQVEEILNLHLGQPDLRGLSTDTYWTVTNEEAKGQFVRLRDTGIVRQITVKARDRDSANDRLELEVESQESSWLIRRLITAMMGKYSKELQKDYTVYFIKDNTGATVSCYEVEGLDRVVVEIETRSLEELHTLNSQLIPVLMDHFMGIYEAQGSLYEMLVSKEVEI
jgi:CYTH domain-containing protein